MEYLTILYDFIKSRGYSNNQEENEMTGLLNILSFFTSFCSIFACLFTFCCLDDTVYTTICASITIVYGVIILLNHLDCTNAAKFYFSTFIPLLYLGINILIGGFFSQSIICGTTIAVIVLLINNDSVLRNRLVAFNIGLFFLSVSYSAFYEPVFGVRDYPLDEFMVFLICLVWASFIFSVHEFQTKKYIESLQIKQKELEQKTTEMERFTYIASHDLKAPLRNIANFLKLTRLDISKGRYDRVGEFLEFAETGASQMNELIEGVLEIAKLEDNSKKNYALVDLNNTLRKVIANLSHEINNCNAIVSSDYLPKFPCNEAHLLVVFQNLIQNSLKYNTSGVPKVTITSEKNKQYHIIHFTDNGIGIAEEHHQQIFEFFKRLHNKDKYQGTGLGLGLCKKIIEQYNGAINIKSKVGAYSTFSIHLPLATTFIESTPLVPALSAAM